MNLAEAKRISKEHDLWRSQSETWPKIANPYDFDLVTHAKGFLLGHAAGMKEAMESEEIKDCFCDAIFDDCPECLSPRQDELGDVIHETDCILKKAWDIFESYAAKRYRRGE